MKGRNIVDKIVLKTATLKDKEFLKLIYNDELVNKKSLNTEIRVVNDKEIIIRHVC